MSALKLTAILRLGHLGTVCTVHLGCHALHGAVILGAHNTHTAQATRRNCGGVACLASLFQENASSGIGIWSTLANTQNRSLPKKDLVQVGSGLSPNKQTSTNKHNRRIGRRMETSNKSPSPQAPIFVFMLAAMPGTGAHLSEFT